MEPNIDTQSTISYVPTRNNCSCITQDPSNGTEDSLLQSDDNINYIPVRYGSGKENPNECHKFNCISRTTI